jgi:hypothetical protein
MNLNTIYPYPCLSKQGQQKRKKALLPECCPNLTACSTAAAPAQHSREKKKNGALCVRCTLAKHVVWSAKPTLLFCCCCFGSVCTHCSNNIQHVRGSSVGWVSPRTFKYKPPPPNPKILKALNPSPPPPSQNQINWKSTLQWVPSVFPS